MIRLSILAALAGFALAGCSSMQTEAPIVESSGEAKVSTATPVVETARPVPVTSAPPAAKADTPVPTVTAVAKPERATTTTPSAKPTPADTTAPLEQAVVETRALPAAATQPPVAKADITPVSGAAAAKTDVTTPGAHRDPTSPLAQRVIYFEFDSAVIDSRFQPILEAHSAYLKANPGFKVILQGHADERGSREYNLALGQRRAESVRQALALLGVADGQMEAVSLGEEKPAVEGHDESAWKMNRRTEIHYIDE